MNLKLLASVACSAALLLSACSSNNTTGTSSGGGETGNGDTGGTGGSDSNGDSAGNTEPPEIATARTAVGNALSAATRVATGSEADRGEAVRLINEARRLLDAAVTAAETAVTNAEGGTATAIGEAARALRDAINLRDAEKPKLDRAAATISWLVREMKRSAISRTAIVIPTSGANKVTITARTPRTIPTSETDNTPKANPDAIKSDKFKYVKYSDGKVLLTGGGRTSAGTVTDDKFKVDGDVVGLHSDRPLDTDTHTELTLTSTGLSIRVGGTRSSGSDAEMTDYTDMRKDITATVDDPDADGTAETPAGQNAWDLTITFDAPLFTSIADGGLTSWQGNGDFYWRGIVSADESQLLSSGDNYESDAFKQPTGPVDQRDLGTYEVWLSNHFNFDKGLEPTDPNAPPNTADDRDLYLNYAAYGLFIYTASPETFNNAANDGHKGRVQSMSFGYQAFADETGKRTRDIGKAISSGAFIGETFATLIEGPRSQDQVTTLLRGDVSLSVTIPKDSATAGRLHGTLSGFEEWIGTYWQKYKPNSAGEFSVRLDGGTVGSFVDIGANGSYSGTATAVNGVASDGRDALLGADDSGTFKGNFYGPRANADDLETVGSWNVGPGSDGHDASADSIIIGSFGAKQRPAP